MLKSIEKLMHLGIDFWSDVGGFLERKWKHVGTKIDEKSIQNRPNMMQHGTHMGSWSPGGHQMAQEVSWWQQQAPRWPQGGSKTSRDGPKRPSMRAKWGAKMTTRSKPIHHVFNENDLRALQDGPIFGWFGLIWSDWNWFWLIWADFDRFWWFRWGPRGAITVAPGARIRKSPTTIYA